MGTESGVVPHRLLSASRTVVFIVNPTVHASAGTATCTVADIAAGAATYVNAAAVAPVPAGCGAPFGAANSRGLPVGMVWYPCLW